MKDYYYILGVNTNSSEEDIKSAYRKLSMKFHPDKNDGEKYFEDRFKEIQEAYETLSNTEKKKSYSIKFKQSNYKRSSIEYLREKEEIIRIKLENKFAKRQEDLEKNFLNKEVQLRQELLKKIEKEIKEKKIKILGIVINPWFLNVFLFIIMFSYFLIFNNSKSEKEITDTQIVNKSSIVDFVELTRKWDRAHVNRNKNTFITLFSNSVIYYGQKKDKYFCINNKFAFFEHYPDFHHEIISDIQIEKIDDSNFKSIFLKRITVNQESSNYPSYLVFSKIDEEWKIIVEGDLVTDKNIANKQILNLYN